MCIPETAPSVCREVLEESRELRIMLCREKRTGTRVGTSVIAACGEPPQPASTATVCNLFKCDKHAADVQQLARRCAPQGRSAGTAMLLQHSS